MSPGHPISVEREANSRQVLEYSERKRSLKKTQVEANFYFVHRKILQNITLNNYFRLKMISYLK